MRMTPALLLLLVALPAQADLPKGVYATARPIVLADGFAGGMIYLPLDDSALAADSLAEYRIARHGVAETPYRMVLEDGSVLEEEARSKVVDWTETGAPDSVRIALDLGADGPKVNLLRLSLTGDDFSAAASVTGSETRTGPARALATERIYRRGAGFQKTSLAFTPTTERYLHLTLTREQGKLPKVEGVRAFSTLTIPRRTAPMPAAAKFSEDTKRKRTVIELDPGRLVRDLVEARLTVSDPVFDRAVTIELAYAEPAEGEEIAYMWSEGARLTRKKSSDPAAMALSRPRVRDLRISVANGDDRPLDIKGVELVRLRRGLVFSAEPGPQYELWYGRKQAPEPSYDLSKLPLTRPDELPEAKLGAARALALAPPPPPPWSERHRALFWAILALVAVLLLVVIIRAMKAAMPAASS